MTERRRIAVTFRFTVGPEVSDDDVDSLISDAYAQLDDPVVRDSNDNTRRLDLSNLTVEREP